MHAELDDHRSWGFGEDDYRELGAADSSAVIGGRPNLGARFTPHCAAIHPAKLVRGLARGVERIGVTIYEGTAVQAIEAGRLRTRHGTVRADTVVRATNLAGRTIADLVLGRDTDLVRLPWVGHQSPRWEPEPLRWLGVNGSRKLVESIDRAEARGRDPKRRTRVMKRLLG